ncbi:MAG: serine hydrolase [Phycisphaeraceae bacterium]|nr:serine hydrolase [Phycisphaeraceae bacterium]
MHTHALVAAALCVAPTFSAPALCDDLTMAERMAWLERRLDEERVEQHIPGMAIVVVKDGQIVLAKGFGQRDIEADLPATPDTLFAIGSSTKAMTSFLVGTLIDQGEMAWDDPIQKHLPWFTLADAERGATMTVRDVLCHRTGYMRLSLLWAGNLLPREQVLRHVAEAEPVLPLGQGFLYNNVMYMSAGAAAEAASGQTWETLIRARILGPLGMQRTTPDDSLMQADADHATGYQWMESSESWKRLPMRRLEAVAPAGAINSSVREMSHWITLLLDRGEHEGDRLISGERFDEMWAPTNPLGPTHSYGLGWFISEWNGHRVIDHGGNIDGYASTVALLPDDGIGFVLLQNVSSSVLQGASQAVVWTALLGDEADLNGGSVDAPAGAAMTEEEMAPLLGRYHSKEIDTDLTVLIQDGKLALDVPGQMVFPLKWPNEQGRWVFELTDEIALRFNRAEDGSITSLTSFQGGMEFELPRVEAKPPITREALESLRRKIVPEGGPPARLRMRGTLHAVNQGVRGTTSVVADGERFVYVVDFGDLGRIAIGYDGTRAWTRSVFEPATELDEAEAELVRLQHPLAYYRDWDEIYTAVEVRAEREVDGRRAYEVVLTPHAASRSIALIDAETGALISEQLATTGSGGIPVPTSFTYFDPVEIGGILLPRRVEFSNEGIGRTVLEFTSIETDIEVNDADFAPPE